MRNFTGRAEAKPGPDNPLKFHFPISVTVRKLCNLPHAPFGTIISHSVVYGVNRLDCCVHVSNRD